MIFLHFVLYYHCSFDHDFGVMTGVVDVRLTFQDCTSVLGPDLSHFHRPSLLYCRLKREVHATTLAADDGRLGPHQPIRERFCGVAQSGLPL